MRENVMFGIFNALAGFWLAVFLIFASGCSTLSKTVEDHPVAAEAAIKIATVKVVDGDQDRAERIVELVDHARQLSSGDSSVAFIADSIHDAIRWDSLSPEERTLVDLLLSQVQKELEERIGEGLIDSEDRVIMAAVLDWIEEAASSG